MQTINDSSLYWVGIISSFKRHDAQMKGIWQWSNVKFFKLSMTGVCTQLLHFLSIFSPFSSVALWSFYATASILGITVHTVYPQYRAVTAGVISMFKKTRCSDEGYFTVVNCKVLFKITNVKFFKLSMRAVCTEQVLFQVLKDMMLRWRVFDSCQL